MVYLVLADNTTRKDIGIIIIFCCVCKQKLSSWKPRHTGPSMPPKTNDANSLSIPSHSFSLPLSFPSLSFIPFPSLVLFILVINPLPKSSYGAGEPPEGSGQEPLPQTHFDTFTGLKTHLVAASFNFPQHFL